MGKKQTGDRIGRALYTIYLIMLIVSVVVCLRILYIQYIWKPDPKLEAMFTPRIERQIVEPDRGKILADDGRVLATSFPKYQMTIDCNCDKISITDSLRAIESSVRKTYKKSKKSTEQIDALVSSEKDAFRKRADRRWQSKAKSLSEGLEKTFPASGKSAAYYYELLTKLRASGSRYMKIGYPIEKDDMDKLKDYPLANQSRNAGGIGWEKVPARRFPYGPLAARTIGKSNDNSKTGIEGRYDSILCGKPGQYYTRKSDNGDAIDYDSLYVNAVDGQDIRTTINVDCQYIADRALRTNMLENENVAAGCCVLMDVKTGAVKAMVNLTKDSNGTLGENDNMAVTWMFEPGSVFKIVALTALAEDGYVTSIDQTIPSNHGRVPNSPRNINAQQDKHIVEYEQELGTDRVPIWYCVQKSSNYAFRYLVKEHYMADPQRYVKHLDDFQLTTPFDFDVSERIAKPMLTRPESKGWHSTNMYQLPIGYSVSVTPMHLLTFYNALANKGVMMKPYLVEDIEKDGKVSKQLGPTVLNSSICSPQTAELVTGTLKYVTKKGGTARRLEAAPCTVVGKTGTSFLTENGKYVPAGQPRRNQGTFVGFFPAEDPQYSIVCTIFTRPIRTSIDGGNVPAMTVLQIVKELYKIDPYWNENI